MPDTLVVLDDENDLAIAGTGYIRRRNIRCAHRSAANVARQIDLHGRAVSRFRIDLDVAATLLHETVDLAQAKPGTLSDAFCRVEGIESPLHHFRRHSGPGVRDGDDHVLAWRDVGIDR